MKPTKELTEEMCVAAIKRFKDSFGGAVTSERVCKPVDTIVLDELDGFYDARKAMREFFGDLSDLPKSPEPTWVIFYDEEIGEYIQLWSDGTWYLTDLP